MASQPQKNGRFWPQQIPGPLAVIYDKIAVPGLTKFHQQVACEITSSLTCGTVVDIGTGPGHLLVEIARRGPDLKLVGFDLSGKMLSMAKALIERDAGRSVSAAETDSSADAKQTDVGSIRLVHGDVQNLPFPDGAFDLVVSTLSIHHWRDPAEGLRQCTRVMAPGGRCWIYDLRTDVWPRSYESLLAGGKAARMLLSWIFRFHGVNPRYYEPSIVASWLDSGVTVRADVHSAYLKLSIEKPRRAPQDHQTVSSRGMSSESSPALAAS